MEREKTLFIYNPNAGTGALRQKLSEVVETFMRGELDVHIFATEKRNDAYDFVRCYAKEVSRVICAGGDGTLHEVARGLMEMPAAERPICGYIPTGTINDFATSIELPKKIPEAARIAAGNVIDPFDIGEMNGQYFTYVAAFGAFTSVSYETPQVTKNILGKVAYYFQGVTQLGQIKSYHVKVKTDHDEWQDNVVLGMITNAKSVGGMNFLKKGNVKLNDGYFEGIFVKTPTNPVELSQIAGSFLTGELGPQIHMFRCRTVEIKISEKVTFTLDGENGDSFDRVKIKNNKRAIRFLHG